MNKARLTLLIVAVLLGCSRQPRLPRELTFEGARLEKATDWATAGISGVVFVPPGEKPETASLQVGILVSTNHSSGANLHAWVMEQYSRSPTQQWHTSSIADEACKIGLPTGPPRPFVALHVCRTGSVVPACAEADERLDDEIVGHCLNRGSDCWDELCSQKSNAWRAPLEAVVREVVGTPRRP